METIALGPAERAGSVRSTTRLGFGTSSVMGVLDRRQSLVLLEAAYDAGIRHFDTAPLYGYGEAESCVGEFLVRHRDATIATKFGVPAPPRSAVKSLIRSAARPVMQALPGLKRLLRPAALAQTTPMAEATPREPNPIFTAAQARASLEASLRALRVERVDLWLLHEVRAIDLGGPAGHELLRLMEDAVSSGKVGSFGAGSDRAELPALEAGFAPFCRVTQSEWSVFNPVPQPASIFRLHHRALSSGFGRLATYLQTHAGEARRWSEFIGVDLLEKKMLPRLMLHAAYTLNAGSVILFASKHPAHIVDNVATVMRGELTGPAQRLYTLVQRDGIEAAPAGLS